LRSEKRLGGRYVTPYIGAASDILLPAARLLNRHRPAPDSSAFLARAFRRRPHPRVVRPRKLSRESRLDRPAAWPPVARSVTLRAPAASSGRKGRVGGKHTNRGHCPHGVPGRPAGAAAA